MFSCRLSAETGEFFILIFRETKGTIQELSMQMRRRKQERKETRTVHNPSGGSSINDVSSRALSEKTREQCKGPVEATQLTERAELQLTMIHIPPPFLKQKLPPHLPPKFLPTFQSHNLFCMITSLFINWLGDESLVPTSTQSQSQSKMRR